MYLTWVLEEVLGALYSPISDIIPGGAFAVVIVFSVLVRHVDGTK